MQERGARVLENIIVVLLQHPVFSCLRSYYNGDLPHHCYRHSELPTTQLVLWEPPHGWQKPGRPATPFLDILEGCNHLAEPSACIYDRKVWSLHREAGNTCSPGIKLGTHWWEASTLNTCANPALDIWSIIHIKYPYSRLTPVDSLKSTLPFLSSSR